MLLTLENVLERIVIGSHELATDPRSTNHSNPLPGNNEMTFPEHNARLGKVAEEIKIEGDTRPNRLGTIHTQSALEKIFPSIAENLTLVWGNLECLDHLNKLIINNRVNHQCFSLES